MASLTVATFGAVRLKVVGTILGGARSGAFCAVLAIAWFFFGFGCQTEYDEAGFRKAIEEAYADAHPGWTIFRKKNDSTWFHRGDQVDELRVSELYAQYRASGVAGTRFVAEWREAEREEDRARRRTLEQAKEDVIPILKSQKWLEYQDLGAIGPPRMLPEIRLWRHEVTAGLFLVLGVPEKKLGYRFASIAEVERSNLDAEAWIEKATRNLVRKIREEAVEENGEYKGVEVEVKGQIKAFDLANADGVSALILDRGFRKKMLEKFARDELGAAVPIRKVLIVFDPDDFVAVKPARNRTHQLYDTQNHPGFRGLLRFDEEGIRVLEPGN